MRGKKLFESVTEREEPIKQGRSAILLDARNRALVDRFYFYSTFSKLRYDCIMENLSKEFYISAYTIAALLKDRYDLVSENKAIQISPKQLERRHPHLNWKNTILTQ